MVVLRGALATLMLGGCVSLSSVQTADTLGKGRLQVAVEPGVWGGATSEGARLLPHVDAAVRYGVSDRVDLGVRAGSSFLELMGKVLLTEPSDAHLAVSVAPAASGGISPLVRDSAGRLTGVGGIVNLALPVLVGFKTAGGSELVLGPRVHGLLTLGPTRWLVLAAGMSAGFLWRLGERVGLMPEVSVVMPIATNQTKVGVLDPSGPLLQIKVGVLFGAFRPRPNDPGGLDANWAPPP